MELKVTITQKGAIFEGKAPEILQKALDEAMSEAVTFMEGRVKALTPRRTGLLAQSIHGEIERGTPVVRGIVAHQSRYGDLVERGTGIYGPRGQEFIITPKDKKALFWPGAKYPVMKVVQQGFPGRHMFEQALNENFGELQEIFNRCGFEIARKLSE